MIYSQNVYKIENIFFENSNKQFIWIRNINTKENEQKIQ